MLHNLKTGSLIVLRPIKNTSTSSTNNNNDNNNNNYYYYHYYYYNDDDDDIIIIIIINIFTLYCIILKAFFTSFLYNFINYRSAL